MLNRVFGLIGQKISEISRQAQAPSGTQPIIVSSCGGLPAMSIVLPENWTGGLDGESEETIIPSREIYETTT
jgi:hypothetical protein